MRNLFTPPSEALSHDTAAVLRAVHAATPLSRVHERELSFAVRDLSYLLTQDRSQLSSSYWVNKRLLTAYCRYFLPWNLLRLSRLLPGLDLPLPEGARILDLGSGPLTMPLALWLAKPAWREMPLTIVCGDVSPAPMQLGRDIFRLLAPESPWTIELVRGPLEKILRECAEPAALVTAANVLNEIRPSRETPLQSRLSALMRRIAGRMTPEGRFLAVEPGTRLGGKLMALTRQAAFGARMVPESPCPHWGPCPMLAERATGWCHFSHRADAVPQDLAEITKKAGLEKNTLTMSCMLLRRATEEEIRRAGEHFPAMAEDEFDEGMFDEAESGDDDFDGWAEAFALAGPEILPAAARNTVRILSDPIRLPEAAEPARYACSCKGLVLAHNALRMPSGAAVTVRWPERETRDGKTGALAVFLPLLPDAKTRAARPSVSAPAGAPRTPRAAGAAGPTGPAGRAREKSVPHPPEKKRRPSKPGEGRPSPIPPTGRKRGRARRRKKPDPHGF